MGALSDRPVACVAGRYELEHELARGGMGVVYRAIDRTTGSAIALKRGLAEHEHAAQLTRSMLQREYQTLVTLRHPHIIQVHDFGVDEQGPYYTMELLEGSDLRSKCPLPWRDVCAYLRDVTSSLALLHSRRLLHCDVSVSNVYLTRDGRAKLLDFGALASFGRNKVIAGAPPTIAPEVLRRDELDQRVDLYALGATAYYALCGRHAYPVAMIALLPAAWAQGRPPPPSTYVPEIPRELDELVMALLDLDRTSRPASAAELMDRLGAIAGLAPDDDQRVQRSYLYNADLVGRDAERNELDDRLKRALSGGGGGVLIAGAQGLGKSFLLEETARRARVAGARVLSVNARAHPGAYGAWAALVREASPSSDVSPSSRLDDGEAVFLRLVKAMPLVLAVDDLHEADPDSLAAFAALLRSARRERLLLLATFDPDHAHAERPALRLLRDRLPSVELQPFDEKASQAFVTGVFGDVAASPRLATFLHQHAGGNPRVYTEVIHHLIAQGFIRYAEGAWILPDELPAVGSSGLKALVDSAFASRIKRWSEPLCTLARCLSPHRRAFDVEICGMLARGEPALEGRDLLQLLNELVREGVLLEDRGAYAFARSRIQDILYESLSEPQRKRQHARMAEMLVKTVGADPTRGFEIGFHFLLAGEVKQARAHLNSNLGASLMDPDMLIESVPALSALLEQRRREGASDEDVQFIEGMLLTSGYYLDPTVHDRFAGRVLPLLHRTLGVALAERLAPYLGSHLAFVIGVVIAWVKSLVRGPYLVSGKSLMTSLLVLVGACASWSAGACFRLDRTAHARLRELLQVARGLGKMNAFRLLFDLFQVGANVVKGRHAEVQAGLEDQLERLPKVPMMTMGARHQYEAGLQFFLGRVQLLRLDSTTLRCAERIDALGAKHDRLMAQFLRRTFHLHRGDLVAARREEELFDQMAALFGSRWVADVMGVVEFLPHHLAGDVLGLKHTLHRIERLLRIAPGLATHREVVRAMYEGHRGRPDLALKIYASVDAAELAPFTGPIWAAARSHQAECLNTLGRSAEALAICEEARSHLTSADRPYVLAYQQLERESALALAGLGRTEEAARLVDGLLAECTGHDNPLVLGLLHCDRARIACAAGDREAFERHAEAARTSVASTGNAALISRAKRLVDMGRAAGLVAPLPQRQADERGARAAVARNTRAERVLEEVVQAVGARSALLYLLHEGRAALGALHGDAAGASLLQEEIASIAQSVQGEVDESEIAGVLSRIPTELRGGRKVIPLVAAVDGTRRKLVGVLVLGECEKSGALSQLAFSQLASELTEEDDATELL